ncbi:MAG: type II toxin-antitoxin system Phd/YefM family antitoxin [Rhizobacter sp.]|nr:type II toxin-antitoxin system Phd/YefM family antitoxin [Burkholderiales bacterium]
MPTLVNVHDAKTRFSQLLEQAHSGQEIILAKAGKPYARMVPLAADAGKRQPGRLVGRVDDAFFDPLPETELNAWHS